MFRSLIVVLAFSLFAQTAPCETPARFTNHVIHFVTGTDADRKQLTQSDPELKDYLEGEFMIAHEDLRGDGVKEVILVCTDQMWCGHGCLTMVLEKKGATLAVLLSQSLLYENLAVTSEKIGKYRALAISDGKGGILQGDASGTPMFGKQLVYGMRP